MIAVTLSEEKTGNLMLFDPFLPDVILPTHHGSRSFQSAGNTLATLCTSSTGIIISRCFRVEVQPTQLAYMSTDGGSLGRWVRSLFVEIDDRTHLTAVAGWTA